MFINEKVIGLQKRMLIKSKGRWTAKTIWKDKQHSRHAHQKTFKKTLTIGILSPRALQMELSMPRVP